MKRKLFLSLIMVIFLIGIISAQVSYCCERTNEGAWCQNAHEEECNTGFRAAPTSCEATSYCRLGTCINTQEGSCMSNTPQRVCDDNGGIWDGRISNDIPQCQLGCCLIGEQAAFVTQTRCKRLSSLYGLEVNYRTDIHTEAECILSASSDVKGACVFEKEFERSCKMATREECNVLASSGAEFHEGYLCSATSLNTICGPRGGTSCVEGRDEVFFLDTCGNLANVYDNNKLNSENYWTYVAGYGGVEVDCGLDSSNAGSPTCGNCDYFLGSTCKKGDADYGNFICKDLGCVDTGFREKYGRNPEHGETWCAGTGVSTIEVSSEDFEVSSSPTISLDKDKKADLPGSRYFRMLCYDGDVMVEPCAEYRQEVCLESDVNEFKTAACRVNKWQDCVLQDNRKDCENTDMRDCIWINDIKEDINLESGERGCIPRNPPGFDFWEEGSDAVEICSQASSVCVVKLKRSMEGETSDWDLNEGGGFDINKIGTLSCEKNCQCLTPEMAKSLGDPEGYSASAHKKWLENQIRYCSALGDCGVSVNYIDEPGYLEQSDYGSDLLIE